MRWKKKKKPKAGDRRVVKKFLLLVREFNNECRWLEWAEIEEEYIVKHDDNYIFKITFEGWVEQRNLKGLKNE